MNASEDVETKVQATRSSELGLVDERVYEVGSSAVMLELQTEEGLLPVVLQMTAVITLAPCLICLPNESPASIEEIIWVQFFVPSTRGLTKAPRTTYSSAKLRKG
jgi:hypothetical protein